VWDAVPVARELVRLAESESALARFRGLSRFYAS
jgi:hypothetical protein